MKKLFSDQTKIDYQLISISILTGILTGTSFIPFYPWALLFNYAPLWWFWLFRAKTSKQVLLSGWLSQFVFNLIGFHWVYHVAYEFGHIPKLLSILVLIAFASLAHLFVPLVGWIFFKIKTKLNIKTLSPTHPLFLLALLVGLWSLAEIYWPYIFQWHMGYSLYWAKLPLYHWSDVIGFQGLSFLLLLFNALFTYKQNLKYLTIAVAAFAILNASGWYHGQPWIHKKWDSEITFLPVQANIGNAEKIMAEKGIGYQDYIVQKFIELSKKSIQLYPQASVLVWPESAIPDFLDEDYSTRHRPQWIKQFLKENKKYLITGGYSREFNPTHNAKELNFNALFTFNAEGNLLNTAYRKTQLLAFGEYTPFSQWFPLLNEYSPAGEGFNSGPEPRALNFSGLTPEPIKLAPQICYESLYPEHSRKGIADGAHILINITNDSWYGIYSEPYQHLYLTFARAIENRRPLLRVTNTGITSGVEASGKTLVQSPFYTEWSEPITLHYDQNPPLTLYTQYGEYWPFVVLLFTFGGFLGAIVYRQQNKRVSNYHS